MVRIRVIESGNRDLSSGSRRRAILARPGGEKAVAIALMRPLAAFARSRLRALLRRLSLS
jgi:hypothetical protein